MKSRKLTPEHYIKKAIIRDVARWETKFADEPYDTPDEIEAVYQQIVDEQYDQDVRYEMRSGEFETNIQPDWSRHYLSKSVGMEIDDKIIGWTYWFGGSKHAEPAAIDWMGDAYFLELVKEETKTIIVREFKKKES